MMRILFAAATLLAFAASPASPAASQAKAPSTLHAPASGAAHPILFVTQFPTPDVFGSIGGVFATHQTAMQSSPRGGDLWICYPDGTLRNLTAEAGLGMEGLQGPQAIAVRDPSVSWDARKVVFSMVTGAPTQYTYGTWYWQLYEATGFGQGEKIHIEKIAHQPAAANNVEPSYASDGGILFASDLPRNGAAYLYPQLDEYESTPTITGVWKIDPDGRVWQLTDSPSGVSHPGVDAYGRVIFTQWDHLQRDQQCDTPEGAAAHGCFDYASEAKDAAHADAQDLFPEPRNVGVGKVNSHAFNQFLPWTVNQDGTAQETIDHIGAHELLTYFGRSFNDDPAIVDFEAGGRTNPHAVTNWLQIAADMTTPGHYLGIDAPEFYTDAAGQIVSMQAPQHTAADTFKVKYLTPRSGSSFGSGVVPADFNGRYRNPQVLSNGAVVAAYANAYDKDHNRGTRAAPDPLYQFRIRLLAAGANGYLQPGASLTGEAGIRKAISYYDPDVLVSYDGPLWELDPVEVVERPVPPATRAVLEAPEAAAFSAAGVDPSAFRAWLTQKDLAVFVSRDTTSRDAADRQQPFNLSVPGGHSTVANRGKVYGLQWLQVLQGDAVRGETSVNHAATARRKVARTLNDPAALAAMPSVPGAPAGAVKIAADGSAAFFAPARRAMTWQTTDAAGTPVVRERYWLTAQPGEVRACDSCHGVNTKNQAGKPAPQNTPAALVELLAYWKQHDGGAVQP